MTFRATCLTMGLVITTLLVVPAPADSKQAPNTREIVAKVVAVDLGAKSIRIENGTGPSQVLPVVGKAAERLDKLPVGEMFTLTTTDSDDGKRREVIAIKQAKHAPKGVVRPT